MIRVLALGQTPPPLRGAPMMLEFLVRNEMQGIDLRHMRIQLSAEGDEEGKFRWTKLFRLFLFIVRVLYARIVLRPQILYLPPAGYPTPTVLRDAAILCATRPFFSNTVLHFHSCGYRKAYEELPKRWQRWLFRKGIFNADAAIRLTSVAQDNGQDLDARKEFVVPNGISDPFFELPAPNRQSNDCETHPLRILFVSHLCESKGILVAIEACGQLAAGGVAFRLDVVGPFESDEFAERVHERVHALGITAHVHFRGVLVGEQKFACFRQADVFCFPTFFEFESFGIVLLEAMSCSLPVVSTYWSGVPSIVDDGETGFLVQPRDPHAVADRLARLAQDPQLRQQMGAAGRERFLKEFTLSRHLDRMRDVFFDVAGVLPVEKNTNTAEAARIAVVHNCKALRPNAKKPSATKELCNQ
jgi:glycosyltransferase involved in cell wall biosynthesis